MESEAPKIRVQDQTLDLLLMLFTARMAETAQQLASARGEALPRPVPEADLAAALQVLRQEARVVWDVMSRDGWSRNQLYSWMD